MTKETRDLNRYYADLLPLQYKGRPKARATIETLVSPVIMHQTSIQRITFDKIPDSGVVYFRTSQEATVSIGLTWNMVEEAVQTAFRLLPGYSEVETNGSPSGGQVTVQLIGLDPLSSLMVITDNTLTKNGQPVNVTIDEISETLPLAVQNGFDIRVGAETAVGKQLEVVGKYVGVSRIGRGFSTFVDLTDDEYLLLVRAAIGRNYAKSSLADIDDFLQTFFPGQIFVYDFGNMHLGYFISPGTLSSNLLQTFIGQGLLPKPMGVKIAPIIYSLTDELLFGFNTYSKINPFASGFNSYSNYSQNVTWLTYAYVVTL